MPSPSIVFLSEVSPLAHAGRSATRKARCWDPIAVKHAAEPIADLAVGKARHGVRFDTDVSQSAIVRRGMSIVSVERDGARGKDTRGFLVARSPA